MQPNIILITIFFAVHVNYITPWEIITCESDKKFYDKLYQLKIKIYPILLIKNADENPLDDPAEKRRLRDFYYSQQIVATIVVAADKCVALAAVLNEIPSGNKDYPALFILKDLQLKNQRWPDISDGSLEHSTREAKSWRYNPKSKKTILNDLQREMAKVLTAESKARSEEARLPTVLLTTSTTQPPVMINPPTTPSGPSVPTQNTGQKNEQSSYSPAIAEILTGESRARSHQAQPFTRLLTTSTTQPPVTIYPPTTTWRPSVPIQTTGQKNGQSSYSPATSEILTEESRARRSHQAQPLTRLLTTSTTQPPVTIYPPTTTLRPSVPTTGQKNGQSSYSPAYNSQTLLSTQSTSSPTISQATWMTHPTSNLLQSMDRQPSYRPEASTRVTLDLTRGMEQRQWNPQNLPPLKTIEFIDFLGVNKSGKRQKKDGEYSGSRRSPSSSG